MVSENKILGVCLWLSYKFDLNLYGLRALFLIFLFLGVGSPLFMYLVLYLLKPSEY
jgi:phage shock protein PspC (stress-responsive transcriptional regulator)